MVGVIVLSKDRPDLFRRCAASVPDAPPVRDRIVFNNGADPATSEAAAALGWREYHSPKNVSFSEGNNRAVEILHPDCTHALLLNNDVTLHQGALETLWRYRDEADVLGCLILDPDGRVNHAGVVPHRNGGLDHLGRGMDRAAFGPFASLAPQSVAAVTFACALVSLGPWRRLGGLDPRYWYCYEDADYCLRVREQGGRVAVCVGAVVTHAESSTRCPYKTADDGLPAFRGAWPTERLLRACGVTR